MILVEVSLKEWEHPDGAGMAARGVNYVLIGSGPDRESARASVRGLADVPPNGWVEVGPFEGWIEPTDSLEEAKEYVQSEELCFIATACYGTAMAKEVFLLREFRDQVLFKNGPGRAFISFYYRHSPPIAQLISKYPWLNFLVRNLSLSPMVAILQTSKRLWRPTPYSERTGVD